MQIIGNILWLIFVTVFLRLVGGFSILESSCFALGFFGIMLFHEFGHYIFLRILGVKSKIIVTLPLGAVVKCVDQEKYAEISAEAEAAVTLAGPTFSVIPVVLITCAIRKLSLNPEFLTFSLCMASLMVLLNLFPSGVGKSCSDGGRLVWFWASYTRQEDLHWFKAVIAMVWSLLAAVSVGIYFRGSFTIVAESLKLPHLDLALYFLNWIVFIIMALKGMKIVDIYRSEIVYGKQISFYLIIGVYIALIAISLISISTAI